MSLSPKTRLGTYEIVGPLGAGGMGEVYRARDLRLGREVAVTSAGGGILTRPARPLRTRSAHGGGAQSSQHRHPLLRRGENGIRFLTMELVEGQTLSTLVSPGGLPLPRILDLSIPLSDALVAAHERGVIHRDLKPGNVMVTREGRVKVLDFGLAKMAGDEAPAPGETVAATSDPISGEGQMRGTVPYMAPEQVRGETVDARSDLFALGIILYELATGRRPFAGDTSADISSSILRDTPEPITRVRTDLSSDLDRIVSRCLEKNVREGAQSALDVNNELRRMRKSLERGEPNKPTSDKVATIAVLPFVNRSASTDDEYFSDGLADELLNVLSKIKGLRVSARSSAFTFKGQQVTVAEVGKVLNVATVLEGSVRKAGNRVRISVQLVKVSDGYHLWSETYDRTLEDIFAVQDDIAQSVVKELRTALLGEEADSDASGEAKADVAKAAKGRTTDPEAHRLYLQARHLIDRRTPEDVKKAIEYLKQAQALDPEFALAWAELGGAHAAESHMGWAPVSEAYGQARDAVERALTLEPDLADGIARMGFIQIYYDWDWRGAQASMRRALELAPENSLALRGTAMLASILGHSDEAIGLYRRTLEQDPLSSLGYHTLGHSFRDAGRHAEAEGAYRKSLELTPNRSATRSFLSLALLALGRGEEALAEAKREPDVAFRLWALAIIHHALGRRAESDAALRDLIEKNSGDSAYQIAEVHGARGDVNEAFEWLERAYAQRDGGLPELKASTYLRSLHGDPRWRAFLTKMGFEG